MKAFCGDVLMFVIGTNDDDCFVMLFLRALLEDSIDDCPNFIGR